MQNTTRCVRLKEVVSFGHCGITWNVMSTKGWLPHRHHAADGASGDEAGHVDRLRESMHANVARLID
jgi:hypothetical protein